MPNTKNLKKITKIDSELVAKFKLAFDLMKKDLGFNSTLEELDEVFYFTDYILQVKFISPKLSRMLCGRIRDTFNLWITQLHAWLVPNPYSMIGLSESQAFNDKEKEEITKIMAKFMAFTSQNILIGLTKDKMKEAEYFDNAMTLWNDSKPIFIKYSKKVNEYWKSRLGD